MTTNVFLIVIIFGIAGPSFALTEKDSWAKNHQADVTLPDNEPASLIAGGPDSYGYYFIDSDDSAQNAPTYRWVDISSRGTPINFNQDDQTLGPFAIEFMFNFYGQNYSTFRACTNGWVTFSSFLPEYFNRPLPSPTEPNNLLAVFWDDLYPDSLSHAYFWSNSNDSCIIAWHNFRHYGSGGDYTFEVILRNNGDMIFQYLMLSGITNSHSIGIENNSGTVGLQYIYNTERDESHKAILFSLSPPRYANHDVLPTAFRTPSARGLVGQAIYPSVRFFNNGSFQESFTGRLVINHGGDIYNRTVTINNLNSQAPFIATFQGFTPSEEGVYRLTATSELVGDQIRQNDTIRFNYNAYAGIYTKDFEANDGGFVGNWDWQCGQPTRGPSSAHSGIRCWGTILNGNYSIGPLLSSLISDTLTLGTASLMSFWHWYDTEAMFDGGNVKISTDGGASWEIITPLEGYDLILSTAFGNPIGGEPAFSGSSPRWLQVNFDLSAYAGSTVLFKFDFGSDDSQTSFGWYIDDFSLMGGTPAGPAWIGGTVADLDTTPIANAIVRTWNGIDTTDGQGRYLLRTLAGLHSISANAQYHNSVTVDSVMVVQGDTINQNFLLGTPGIDIDTSPLDTAVVLGDSISFIRTLRNPGDGDLEYDARIDYGSAPQLFDFGDELFTFDPQTPTDDDQCLGVEFDGANFWVTGRHGIDEVHKLYKFDRNGQFIQSYDQETHSTWGWRDLAFDGSFLYAADENELAKIDLTTGHKIDTLPRPSGIQSPIRALAYDPATDHFWGGNFTSNIIEFDRTGQTIHSFANSRHVFGLAWDDASAGGPWLWVFSQDGDPAIQVSQFDPRNGVYTGVQFQAVDHNAGEPDLAGGACFTKFWDPTKGIFFGLVMGRQTLYDSHDLVQGYEITALSHWARVLPSSGVIAPSGSADLRIVLDFTGGGYDSDSTYEARLVFENNSANIPEIPITARLRPSGIDNDWEPVPHEFALYKNYPNPFNSSTQIRFALPSASDVRIDIFNILGQRVATIADGKYPAGFHEINWNSDGMSSGIYYYRFNAGHFSKIDKMILLK